MTQHAELRNHLSGTTRPSSAKTRKSKVNFATQSVINEILPQLPGQIAAGLADYLRDNGADHSEPGSTGVVLAGEGRYEIYLDGQFFVCIDRDDSDRRHELRLSSLNRYFTRARRNSISS